MNIPPRSVSLRRWLAALVPIAGTLCAQTVTPAPSPTANPREGQKADEIVALAPMEVRADLDNGYTAADTISAGRLSTNLLMTPSDTTALTRDFLNDIGAFTMVE